MSQSDESLGSDTRSDRAALQREIEQLNHAVESRNVIGQAQGIIMARLDIDAHQAMSYLKRLSSTSNRKVIDLATDIASSRRLPVTH